MYKIIYQVEICKMKINESEFEELQFYKRKLIVSFKLSLLFLLLFFPTFYFMFHMEKKYVILLYIYNLLVLLSVILINKKYDLAKYYLLHMFNFSLFGSVVIFIFGFFISNIHTFNWNTNINIIISFFLMSCPLGIVYGVKNWAKKLNTFIKTGVIDKENNIINFYISYGRMGGRRDSNPQQLEPQSRALPLNYFHHVFIKK